VPDLGGNGNDGAGYASIMISQACGVRQYVQMTGRGLIGVRASDGKFLWGYNAIANGTANIPDAVIAGDHVFCSTGYGTGAALVRLSKDGDGVSAKELYFLKGDVMQNHHGGMVLVDGSIYCGHKQNGGDPVCIDIKTGKLLWAPERGAGKGSANVTYADGHLIYRYQNGEVALVEATPKKYRLKGSFKPAYQERESWSHPVIANGKLYLREQNKLMCYGL
jgi:prepilin-type processing-associated H-X9-DG protein